MITAADRLAAYNKRRNASPTPTDPRVDVGARAVYEAEGRERTYEEFKEKQRHLSMIYTDEAQIMIDALDKAAEVTTTKELDALGFNAVVLDPCGTPAVCQRSGPDFCEWALGGSGELIDSDTLLLSGSGCTVLHRGDAS